MGKYLAQRLIDKSEGDPSVKFTYAQVIAKYPTLKFEIDSYLQEKGRSELINA